MPTAKLCFMLGEIDRASQARRPSTVMSKNSTPLTKTVPSRCSKLIDHGGRASVKAMKAFSPM